MIKFVYKSKKTGKKVTSETPIKDDDLVLVTKVSDTRMKSNEIRVK